jgi:cytochrome bd ubiquinol oxidase subunit I
MEFDPLLLSRIQFAFVVSFHAIFPVFTIGLATYIALLEAIAYRTERSGLGTAVAILDQDLRRGPSAWAWSRARDGLPVRHQLERVHRPRANFLGPLLAYEVVTAFFLEAAFLGVLLFGRNKVPPGRTCCRQ